MLAARENGHASLDLASKHIVEDVVGIPSAGECSVVAL